MATDVSYFEVQGDPTQYQFNDPDAENRVSALGLRLQTAEGNITTLQGTVSGTQGDVTDLQGNVTNLQGDVTTLQGDVTTLQGDVTTAQGDITNLQGDLDEVRTLPVTQTSGNWTWWEFESGLIIGIAAISVSYTPSTANGNIYRTANAVSLGTTPFAFSSGEIMVLASQVQWAVNPSVNASTRELSCYFCSGVNSARTPTVRVIFVGQNNG